MKKTIKKNIVLVMLFTTLCSYATEISSFKTNEDGKTTLILKGVKIGEQLIIKDTYNVVLFRESVKENGYYARSFDLTDLPDGVYNFELYNDIRTKIIPFEVKLRSVKINKSDEKIIYNPVVRVKDDLFYITKLNLKKEPFKIQLFYENTKNGFDLLHSEIIENTNEIKKIYKLSNEKKGVYKLIFKSDGRVVEKRITI